MNRAERRRTLRPGAMSPEELDRRITSLANKAIADGVRAEAVLAILQLTLSNLVSQCVQVPTWDSAMFAEAKETYGRRLVPGSAGNPQ